MDVADEATAARSAASPVSAPPVFHGHHVAPATRRTKTSPTPMQPIAVVSRDFELRCAIDDGLRRYGFGVLLLADTDEAARRLANRSLQLVVLDLRPSREKARAIAQWRLQYDLPLIVIGADTDEVACAVALESGADDYLVAPLRLREFAARVQALLRRGSRATETATRYRFADCAFDIAERRLHGPRGESLRLTSAEAKLLAAFVNAPQRVLSRERLVDKLHAAGEPVSDRSIDMRVLRLRRRLRSLGLPAETIATERAHGYALRLEVQRVRPSSD